MGKLGRIIMKLMLLAISMPVVKGIYDNFTDPVTGLLVTMGVPDDQLAIVGAVPWAIPLAIFVWLIIDFAKPEEPKQPNFNFPRQPKQKPPKFPGLQ